MKRFSLIIAAALALPALADDAKPAPEAAASAPSAPSAQEAYPLLAEAEKNATNNTLNRETIQSVIWMQQSGEREALSYQTYAAAARAFDAAKTKDGLKKAAVVDLDETTLDNMPYAAWQVVTGSPWTNQSWLAWRNSKAIPTVPGSKEFVNHVIDNGGTVFFVSNSDHTEVPAVIEDLKRLGYHGIEPDRFLFRTNTSNKQPRFEDIKKRGYDIVVQVGDDLGDFNGEFWHKTNAQRRELVRQNAAKFGTQWFILPNPVYGNWLKGLDYKYYALDPQKRTQLRDDALKPWSGK